MNKTKKFALVSLIFNLACSAYHIILGVITFSWWFLTVGVYYVILSIIRFVIIRSNRNEHHAIRLTGIMLILLFLPLVGSVILAFVKDRGNAFPLILMLAIAVYSFTKITIAIVNWIKSRKQASPQLTSLRNISLADAFVSIASLQRSMLVSFEGMSEAGIQIMNVATGSVVCVIVLALGINLLRPGCSE